MINPQFIFNTWNVCSDKPEDDISSSHQTSDRELFMIVFFCISNPKEISSMGHVCLTDRFWVRKHFCRTKHMVKSDEDAHYSNNF